MGFLLFCNLNGLILYKNKFILKQISMGADFKILLIVVLSVVLIDSIIRASQKRRKVKFQTLVNPYHYSLPKEKGVLVFHYVVIAILAVSIIVTLLI